MSILGLFRIGKEALLAQQRAMNVTSNNIANANTPGYSRQRAIFTPTEPVDAGGIPIGGGVRIREVERITDQALNNQLLREHQQLAFDQRMSTGLSRIEGVFGEVEDSGISSSLGELFQAVQDLSNNPSGNVERQLVVQRATSLGDLIRSTNDRLTSLQNDANQSIDSVVREIDTLATQIGNMNRQIFLREGSGKTAAALRDQRDQLMTQLSEKVDFTSFERSDGQVAIFVAQGLFLVDGSSVGQLRAQPSAASNPPRFEIFHDVSGSIAGPVTTLIQGGELGGLIALRDSVLPSEKSALDEFTFTLADRLNQVHQAGFGLTDDVSRRFFVDRATGGSFASVAGAASQITLNPLLAADPQRIAAGSTSLGPGLGAAPGDNAGALALAGVESISQAVFQVGDPVAGPASGAAATIAGFFGGIVGGLGARLQDGERKATQQDLVVSELQSRQSALSGVSIDEEVAELIKLQHAFQAGARVITTVDRMLETLLSI